MILHAARNPTTQIHGILIGAFGEGPALDVHDALPVFHSPPTKPIIDASLQITEAYIKQNGSESNVELRVVGWYTANELLGDDERPGQAALRVMSGISSMLESPSSGAPIPAHSEPVLILISNSGLASMIGDEAIEKPDAINVFGRDSRKHWLRPIIVSTEGDGDFNSQQAKEVAYAACNLDESKLPIYDFEHHMDCGLRGLKETDWLSNRAVSDFIGKQA
eukprot:CAMPEP_0183297490 /NCGR_PEP_ID=MMETSP0160_2-20130417/4769_1 /TAXON_ID=2839 ORGANISM="Odontella Sinensis, Strain Grunow 1884" /NCGR_SAMPLE_ID=MMETSP0160_2 /ASSEMBLY_ACC=CAM_ASM_000250 /LENGTH=220 /DNA_ID=CAMNT_0025459323 /DNA_START=166 /DNA_END=828 /DNA_ORIENTATION=-